MSYNIYKKNILLCTTEVLKMFKTKKTQFAIRKFVKGAVAVLLSFGILASSSAPIISAASKAI